MFYFQKLMFDFTPAQKIFVRGFTEGVFMKNAVLLLTAAIVISACSKGNDATKTVQSKKPVRIVKLNVEMVEQEKLQKAADSGYQPWRNNPVDVAQAALLNSGAAVQIKDCSLVSEGADAAVIAASDKKGEYRVICKRLVKSGGIWTATEVEVIDITDSAAPALEGKSVHDHAVHSEHSH